MDQHWKKIFTRLLLTSLLSGFAAVSCHKKTSHVYTPPSAAEKPLALAQLLDNSNASHILHTAADIHHEALADAEEREKDNKAYEGWQNTFAVLLSSLQIPSLTARQRLFQLTHSLYLSRAPPCQSC